MHVEGDGGEAEGHAKARPVHVQRVARNERRFLCHEHTVTISRGSGQTVTGIGRVHKIRAQRLARNRNAGMQLERATSKKKQTRAGARQGVSQTWRSGENGFGHSIAYATVTLISVNANTRYPVRKRCVPSKTTR